MGAQTEALEISEASAGKAALKVAGRAQAGGAAPEVARRAQVGGLVVREGQTGACTTSTPRTRNCDTQTCCTIPDKARVPSRCPLQQAG